MVRERGRPARPWPLGLAGALLASSVALAQPSAADQARAHFVKGYELVESGELDAAIAEFEKAYATSPNFAVLYNLGQAYAAVGRSVEAVEKLELYLSLGGNSIPEQRKQQVRATIAYQSRRIGEVALEITPVGARVSLDGRPVGAAPLATPLRATPGPHAIAVTHPGFEPRVATVSVEPQRVTRLALGLTPAQKAELGIDCSVPDTLLDLDGKRYELKLAQRLTLRVERGSHELTFSRPGYVSRPLTTSVAGAEAARVSCALELDPRYGSTARLEVVHPRGTRVLVDGRPHPRAPLPWGRHRVSVSGPGYETAETIVALGPGAKRAVELTPRPSSGVLAAKRDDAERTRRTAGFVVGSVGAVSTLAALAVYLVNDAAYDDWRGQNAELVARMQNQPSTVTPRELDDYLDRENRIRNWDAAAVGLGAFGVASLAGAAVLLLWSEPDPPATLTSEGARLRWRF